MTTTFISQLFFHPIKLLKAAPFYTAIGCYCLDLYFMLTVVHNYKVLLTFSCICSQVYHLVYGVL